MGSPPSNLASSWAAVMKMSLMALAWPLPMDRPTLAMAALALKAAPEMLDLLPYSPLPGIGRKSLALKGMFPDGACGGRNGTRFWEEAWSWSQNA